MSYSVEAKCERVSGLDVDNAGGAAVEAALVAPQVRGAQRRHGRVVVCVLPDVLVHGELGAGHGELLEDVVGRDVADGQRQGRRDGEDAFHGFVAGWEVSDSVW